MSLIERCKGQSAFGNACTTGATAQKRFGRRVTSVETLCRRYSYIELTWGIMLSRNAKMKRETDLGLRKTPSRRTKPIKIFWKRQNEAGNRSNSPKSHFLRRETGKILRKVISRGGKGEKCLGKRLCAAGRRLKVSEIGFARREKGAYGIRPQDVSNGNDFVHPYKWNRNRLPQMSAPPLASSMYLGA